MSKPHLPANPLSSPPEIQLAEHTKQEISLPPAAPQNKDSLVYMFKQQLISAWRPVPSLSSSIILYIVLVIFFTTIGILMFFYTSEQYKQEIRYDNQCLVLNTPCSVNIEVPQDVAGPVYLYYGLTNFNQNQRFYTISKSEKQIEDGVQFAGVDAARQYCGSKTTNGEMGWTTAVDGTPLVAGDVAFPCGMIAFSFFNDTYTLTRNSDSASIPITTTGIAWPNDKSLYKNSNLSTQGIDVVNNEHWLVWLRPAVTSNFYKLWGVIGGGLVRGNYTMVVGNGNGQVIQSIRWRLGRRG